MILKKPYAFFIKNFKIFHLMLSIMSVILLYRTTLIYDFMKEYNKLSPNLIGKELTASLFTPWLYVLIALIIIINIVIIVIMIKKDKPYIYYIANIALYISLLIAYIASNNVIGDLEEMLVAAKTTLAIRDIANIARLLQTISLIFYLVRATGFDIKKFDFVRDLQDLDISEEDSEEIEVALEFEKNVFMRNIKRNIRNFKYYYKENRLMLNVIMLLFIGLILLIIYLNSNKYDKVYNENEFVNISTLNLGIKESSILTKNYKNKTIASDGKVLVALKLSANSIITQQLPTARAVLVIDGIQYYHIKSYQKELLDLGTVYTNQSITNEFNDYLLIYEIPKEKTDSKMIFRYIENTESKRGEKVTNSIDIKLNPIKIDEQKQIQEQHNLTEEIELTKLNNYKIKIDNYEIQDSYTKIYNTCITTNECYDFKEILKPSVTANKEKTLLKIEGTLETKKISNNIKNLYDVINNFATITYTYNGTTYTETNDLYQVTPTKVNEPNTYYIEVNKEIKDASRIVLSLNIRNVEYQYILRGE